MVLDAEGAEASSGGGALAAALEKIGRLQAENAELRVSLAEVLARDAEREAELEKLRADFAVLQRMLFGRSSEKSPRSCRSAMAAVMMLAVRAAGTGDGGAAGT